MVDEITIKRIEKNLPILNEAQKRMYLASEAEALGHGGITQISKATGVSRVTITSGIKDLKEGLNSSIPGGEDTHIRRRGAERKPIQITQPGICETLKSLIEASTYGNPQTPLKNTGAEYSPRNRPVKVLDHDFPLPELGKAAPYGVYDIGANEGYVSVGISADTAQFAVNTIRAWWGEMGQEKYPAASRLLITADGGGSNGSRNRLWKTELQKFADESQLDVTVCHFPPGTSKWNKIETLEIIVNLIASATTDKGLVVK